MQPKSVTGAELWEYEHKYQYTTHQQHNGVRRRLEPKWSITIHVWQRVRITRYCGHCQLHSCNLAVAAAILSPIYTNIYLHTRAGPLKSLSFSLVYALWRHGPAKIGHPNFYASGAVGSYGVDPITFWALFHAWPMWPYWLAELTWNTWNWVMIESSHVHWRSLNPLLHKGKSNFIVVLYGGQILLKRLRRWCG